MNDEHSTYSDCSFAAGSAEEPQQTNAAKRRSSILLLDMKYLYLWQQQTKGHCFSKDQHLPAELLVRQPDPSLYTLRDILELSSRTGGFFTSSSASELLALVMEVSTSISEWNSHFHFPQSVHLVGLLESLLLERSNASTSPEAKNSRA